jgi:hypothetical protein
MRQMMRIGFASIYSWRPHVAMLHYLAALARDAGHETYFLTCDSDLADCYTLEQKRDRPTWLNCMLCRAGGLRSFEGGNVSAIGQYSSADVSIPARSKEWALSSASTLGRFETDEDYATAEFAGIAERLDVPARQAYVAARKWIEDNKLTAICVFNGRFEATRAICEAAEDAGIRYVTSERTWFGDGIQLFPDENCLGLRSVDKIMGDWRDHPLTRDQAFAAAKHIAARFLRKNDKEWRAYNVNASSASWPNGNARRRILLLPGSRSESWGHPDCAELWSERTEAFEALMKHFDLKPEDMLLRCHPVWSETVSGRSGELSENYYTRWAEKLGVRLIASASKDSTTDLIDEADAIVVTGGSAALEAGILGKQVIGISPSIYQQSGFQSNAYDLQRLSQIRLLSALPEPERAQEARRIRRLTLRFCFNIAYRVSQFTSFVEAFTTTRYGFYKGADPQRFIRLLETGELEPDDANYAADETSEDFVLDMIERGEWSTLFAGGYKRPAMAQTDNGRRGIYKAVDRVRELFPRGDL